MNRCKLHPHAAQPAAAESGITRGMSSPLPPYKAGDVNLAGKRGVPRMPPVPPNVLNMEHMDGMVSSEVLKALEKAVKESRPIGRVEDKGSSSKAASKAALNEGNPVDGMFGLPLCKAVQEEDKAMAVARERSANLFERIGEMRQLGENMLKSMEYLETLSKAENDANIGLIVKFENTQRLKLKTEVQVKAVLEKLKAQKEEKDKLDAKCKSLEAELAQAQKELEANETKLEASIKENVESLEAYAKTSQAKINALKDELEAEKAAHAQTTTCKEQASEWALSMSVATVDLEQHKERLNAVKALMLSRVIKRVERDDDIQALRETFQTWREIYIQVARDAVRDAADWMHGLIVNLGLMSMNSSAKHIDEAYELFDDLKRRQVAQAVKDALSQQTYMHVACIVHNHSLNPTVIPLVQDQIMKEWCANWIEAVDVGYVSAHALLGSLRMATRMTRSKGLFGKSLRHASHLVLEAMNEVRQDEALRMQGVQESLAELLSPKPRFEALEN